MRTNREIRETFKDMGLLSEQERKHFEKMERVQQFTEEEGTYFFIRTSGSAYEIEAETEDAKLESDS